MSNRIGVLLELKIKNESMSLHTEIPMKGVVADVDRLAWLDYARFAAALSVVFFHYCSHGINSGKIKNVAGYDMLGRFSEYGYVGVDLFFMISGFVILFSAYKKPAAEFAVARFVRLYPAYFFCMTATTGVVAIWGSGVSLPQYIANLSMVASYLGFRNIDGVYWTLSFEILFYVAVFLVIVLGLVNSLEKIVGAWILLMCLLRLLSLDVPLFGGYYSLFAGGCILAFVYRDGLTAIRGGLLLLTLLLSAIGAYERAVVINIQNETSSNPNIFVLLTVGFYGGFLLLKDSGMWLPFSRQIGMLTYPLYLLHASIGYVLISALAEPLGQWGALGVTVFLMLFFSWMVSYFVETLPRRWWLSFADYFVGGIVRAVVSVLGRVRRP